MRAKAQRLIEAKRAMGFGGFLSLGLLGLLFASGGHVGAVSVFGAPLFGIGFGGHIVLVAYPFYVPHVLGRGVDDAHLVTLAVLVFAAVVTTIPLVWRVGIPQQGSGWFAVVAVAVMQATHAVALRALGRGLRAP